MQTRLIASTLLMLALCAILSGSSFRNPCERPDRSDPDEMFDNIGRKDFCQYFDRSAGNEEGIRTERENLGGGAVNSDLSGNSDGGRAVIYEGENYYVIGRVNNGSNNDFGVMKYHFDGTLDTGFDTDGKATYSFGGGDDIPYAIALYTAGVPSPRFIVVGRTDAGVADAFDFAVMRIHTTGRLDTAFNTNGKAVTNGTSNKADFARAVAVDVTNNRIVVAGYGKNTNFDFFIARYRSSGYLDTSFFTNGKYTAAVGSSDNGALALIVDTAGRYLAAGTSYNGSNWDFAALRVESGSPSRIDTTFNTTGKFTLAIGANDDTVYAIGRAVTSRIALVGSSNNGSNLDFAVARLMSNGSLDTTFYTSGKLSQAVLSGDDAAFSVIYSSNALNLIAAGYAYNTTNNDFAVIRLKSNGSLDTSFSTSGKMTKAIYAGEDTAQAIFAKTDSYFLVAGRTYNGADYDFALMRFNTDGSLARSGTRVKYFGNGGATSADSPDNDADRPYAMIFHTDNKFYVAGRSYDTTSAGYKMALAMFDLSGANATVGKGDAIFRFDVDGDPGTDDKAQSIIYEGNTDKIVMCGDTLGTTAFGVVILTDGTLDASFDGDGILQLGSMWADYDRCIATGYTGSMSVGFMGLGHVTARRGEFFSTFYQTLIDGTYISQFSDDGMNVFNATQTQYGGGAFDYNYDYLHASVDTSSGTIYLLKVETTTGAGDTSFGMSGTVSIQINSQANQMSDGHVLAFRTDGKFYLAYATGVSREDLEKNEIRLADGSKIARFNVNGTLDTSFHTDGASDGTGTMVVETASNVTVAYNEKPVRTTVFAGNGSIVRYTTDGRLDTSFATTGMYTHPNALTPTGIIIVPGYGWICTSGSYRGDGSGENFEMECLWP